VRHCAPRGSAVRKTRPTRSLAGGTQAVGSNGHAHANGNLNGTDGFPVK
jgi:hypothetical protein